MRFCIISGDRCIADYYLRYISNVGKGKFYRRPLPGEPQKFGNQIVGVNKLKTMMKEITDRAGLKGHFTNHSGKRSCATQLYMAGIDEQEIMQRTGHRSEKGVQHYKETSNDILKKVSSVLDPPLKRKSSVLDTPVKLESEESSTSEVFQPLVKKARSILDKQEHVCENTPLKDITNGAVFSNCQISFKF